MSGEKEKIWMRCVSQLPEYGDSSIKRQATFICSVQKMSCPLQEIKVVGKSIGHYFSAKA